MAEVSELATSAKELRGRNIVLPLVVSNFGRFGFFILVAPYLQNFDEDTIPIQNLNHLFFFLVFLAITAFAEPSAILDCDTQKMNVQRVNIEVI